MGGGAWGNQLEYVANLSIVCGTLHPTRGPARQAGRRAGGRAGRRARQAGRQAGRQGAWVGGQAGAHVKVHNAAGVEEDQALGHIQRNLQDRGYTCEGRQHLWAAEAQRVWGRSTKPAQYRFTKKTQDRPQRREKGEQGGEEGRKGEESTVELSLLGYSRDPAQRLPCHPAVRLALCPRLGQVTRPAPVFAARLPASCSGRRGAASPGCAQ